MSNVHYAKLFATTPEFPEPIEATVSGEIPKWLKGTLLKNGPGIFEVGPDTYNHWFDGLAIMQRFFIENGKVPLNMLVMYSSKYLRSETYQRNQNAQRIVVGEFGTLAYPDPCKNIFQRYFSYFFPGKVTDNDLVNFIQCGDEVYASSELAVVNRIDIKTLDTIEKVDMHKYLSVNTATAHPHYDQQGNMLNMGSGFTNYNIIMTPNPKLSKEKTEDGNALAGSKILASIPGRSSYLCYYHSFGMSEHHVIFPEMPLLMNPWKLVTRSIFRVPISESFEWYANTKTLLHVVSLDDSKPIPIKYTADDFFTFHHANAYEKENCLFVDLVLYKDGNIVKSVNLETLRKAILPKIESNYGRLVRFILPLSVPENAQVGDNLLTDKKFSSSATALLQADGSVHCTYQVLCDKNMEFPRINYEKYNGRFYQYCYGTALSAAATGQFFMDELIKIDVVTGEIKVWHPESKAEQKDFVGEPVFIPRPGAVDEDDGVILSPVTNIENDQENILLILDAKSFMEIGRANVKHYIPIGFHAHFVPEQK